MLTANCEPVGHVAFRRDIWPVDFQIEPTHTLSNAVREPANSISMSVAGWIVIIEDDHIGTGKLFAMRDVPFRFLAGVAGPMGVTGRGDANAPEIVAVPSPSATQMARPASIASAISSARYRILVLVFLARPFFQTPPSG